MEIITNIPCHENPYRVTSAWWNNPDNKAYYHYLIGFKMTILMVHTRSTTSRNEQPNITFSCIFNLNG